MREKITTTSSRCSWCLKDPLYIHYHDHEWGTPLRSEQKLFEMLNLEGMQAGLNWLTILKKRENYRQAFDQFNPEKIVRYNSKKIEKLMLDPGIIRNRLKIEAIIKNAKSYLLLKEQDENFTEFIWQFTNGETIHNHQKSFKKIPCSIKQSDQMAKVLKQKGFKFFGTTICYAFMQAVGMVNDHMMDCFRWKEIRAKE